MNVKLREYTLADAPSVQKWMNDAETTRFLGYGFSRPRTLDEVTEMLEMRICGDLTGESFAIIDADTGDYMGECSLLLPDEKAKKAEIAIVILPEYRGNGAGTQAMRLLMEAGFRSYDRLFLKCAANNASAIKLYEKLGFQKEGTLRRDMKIGDEVVDTVIYGMLKEEYLGQKLL